VRAAFADGTWYEGAAVSAELIRELLLDRRRRSPGEHPRRPIDGPLLLNFVETHVPIMLEDCELTDPPSLYCRAWATSACRVRGYRRDRIQRPLRRHCG